MYTNNAYLNNSTVDRKDKSKPLVITMCGTYKLYTKPKLPTWRPRGRLDFQLLYIAAGKAHFHFGSDLVERHMSRTFDHDLDIFLPGAAGQLTECQKLFQL